MNKSDDITRDKKPLACKLELELDDYVLKAMETLEEAGYETWCVGGCIRDVLCGQPPKDFDLASAAEWEQAERLLSSAGFSVYRSGVAHGSITACLNNKSLEITTFRSDGTYSDGRHPDTITYVNSIEDDLKRRDFTMNALAYHPQRGLFDPLGGQKDIHDRLIRSVGDPDRRFQEDGLRILRASRFVSQLDFDLAPDCLAAMVRCKRQLIGISRERITHELDGLLLGEHVHKALMSCVDVLGIVLPEILASKNFEQRTPYHIYDVWEHTARVVQHSPKTRRARWAALFHDLGKPASYFEKDGKVHFYGHASVSALLARSALKRFLISEKLRRDIVWLIEVHDNDITPDKKSVLHALADINGDVELFKDLIGLKRADALAHSDFSKKRLEISYELEARLGEIEADGDIFSVGDLAVSGDDLIAAGVSQGKMIGDVLDALLNEVMDGHLSNDKESLMAFVRQWVHGRRR